MSSRRGIAQPGQSSSVSSAAFVKWAKQREIFVHPDVDVLHHTPDMGGCGVFARRSLPPGTVVLSTSFAASISPYNEPEPRLPSIEVLQSPPSSSHRSTAESAGNLRHAAALPLARRDPLLCVVLRLMAEYCKGRKSLYDPWLQHCPEMGAHLLDLPAAEQLLLGLHPPLSSGEQEVQEPILTSAPSSPLQQRTMCWSRWTGVSQQLRELRVQDRWQIARSEMIEPHPDIWPEKRATFKLFCRCMEHVLSRNFHREEIAGREGPYLLPGLDFLNHTAPPNTVFEVRGGGRKHATAFTVVTCETVKPGQQIFASYGTIGSARFIVEFQFLSADAVARDLSRFSCEQLEEMATLLSTTARLSETNKGGTGEEFAAQQLVATRKEMSRRVELLQRLGLLYDEGLYLKGNGGFRVRQLHDSESGAEAMENSLKQHFEGLSLASEQRISELHECEAAFRTALQAPLSTTSTGAIGTPGPSSVVPVWDEAEQRQAWSKFQAVAFLLSLPRKEAFEHYYHHIVCADWEAPRQPHAIQATRALLLLKLQAVRATWHSVAQESRTKLLPAEGGASGEDFGEVEQDMMKVTRMRLLQRALQSEEGVLLEHLSKLPQTAEREEST